MLLLNVGKSLENGGHLSPPQWVEHTEAKWCIYICFGNLTTTGSDKDLLLGQLQTIIWFIAWILLIGTNFREMLININKYVFMKCIWQCLQNGIYLWPQHFNYLPTYICNIVHALLGFHIDNE